MNKKPSVAIEILEHLFNMGRLLPMPFETPYEHIKRIRHLDPEGYYHSVWQLEKRGAVKIAEKKGKRFLKLTKKGQLQVLVEKARIAVSLPWDGKWRLFMFDIPEAHHLQRDTLRILLKQNNFKKLQASVFVSPNPLNREAIEYLEKTGLSEFVRIMRVDEMDNDEDFRKKFGLKKKN